ncbi:hypothetical protein [Lentilactobacillus kosonis]|uniref:Uncharacterized protein n=1 Tax=Lentilactobacillus kosonis TaxID=2810561 RepID=A0A401FPM2_9LACO|nr:hypothetical protein [Lentilactobacillus kosonis]GAY74293.1 hypothetical protein NBRC111893_2439 [Lentilactobacillus kosonis]
MPKPRKKSVDPNNKLVNFLDDEFLPMLASQVHTHLIGRVISYNKEKAVCDVQPLALQSDGDKRAPLANVIVPDNINMINDIVEFAKWANGHTHPTVGGPTPAMPEAILKHSFKVGSVVWVGIADTELDNWTGKSNFKIETKRQHSVNDAVVEEVLKP